MDKTYRCERPRDCNCSGDCSTCDVRCECGSLMARLVEGGVELKCRRCKRTFVIPLQR